MVTKKVKRTPIVYGAKERIEVNADHWEDCWMCKEVDSLRRQTRLYCAKCNRGICKYHGSFAHNGRMLCIVCGAKREDKDR